METIDIFIPRSTIDFRMRAFMRFSISLSLLFLLLLTVSAQKGPNEAEDNIVVYTEKILGPDDLLVNGTRYLPENLHATGSPLFENHASGESVLYIKGQAFYKIQLEYDIVSDKLILVQSLGNGLENRILLYSTFVDSFKIGDNQFVNFKNFYKESQVIGFFEQVSAGNIRFLKKYSKKYIRIYDASNRGRYSQQTFSCYLSDRKGNLMAANNKKQFLRYFSENKKTVRSFMKDHKIALRKDSNAQLSELMKFCNSLFNETH